MGEGDLNLGNFHWKYKEMSIELWDFFNFSLNLIVLDHDIWS